MKVHLARGDARDVARWVRPGTIEAAYLDPPFAVGARFGARRGKGERAKGETAYVDAWPSLEVYLGWLEERVAAVREVLSPAGTMWLHLDHRAVHEAKLACDRVFGRARFVGEVIWAPGNGARGRRGPGATHQTILLYGKTADFVWNADDPALRAPYADTSLSMHFSNVDGDGRRFRERAIGGKTYRYYADVGRAIGSVWTDCPSMVANTPLRKETTGYPTQKPEKLLDRVVRASTRPGAWVLDPFCGSGTTLVAAAKAGRAAIGIDVGALAIETAAARLEREHIPFEMVP